MLQDAAFVARPQWYRNACFLSALHLEDAADFEAVFDAPAESIQLSAAPFSADVLQLRINSVCIRSCVASGGFRLRRLVGENKVSFAYLNGSEAILESGRPWSVGQVLIVSGRDVDMSVRGASDITWIEIDLPFVRGCELRGLTRITKGSNVLVAPPEQAYNDLRSYVAEALKICAVGAPFPKGADMYRCVESEILRRVEALIAVSKDGAVEVCLDRKAFSLIHRVEQFMWDNVEEPVTLERICANTNCRARSLIYSFKGWFGIGPITYLKILRLNAVHRKLRETGGNVRIFDVATDFGFWHMGHFSTNYKQMFGVTPTQTLRAHVAEKSFS